MSKKLNSPLGKILVDNKIITQEQLQEVILAQDGTGLRLGEFLVKKGIVKEDDIVLALGESCGFETMLKIPFNDKDNFFSKLPVNFLKKNKIIPFEKVENTIKIALVDPLTTHPIDDLKIIFPGFSFEIYLTSLQEIDYVLSTHFDLLKNESTDNVIEDLEDSDFEILSSDSMETEDIMDMANDAPIIRLVNTIIKQAIEDRASDIHIEPYEKKIIVRFRIDGILYQMFTPPKKYQNAIISRIKIMANLNIAENRLPQDGRIQLKISGKDIDIRISTFPTYYGERVVLRLLNKTDMSFELNSIGFSKDTLDSFENTIKKTHGVVLVTGPTGSGKSTTLYSVLSKLNDDEVNILTVEDPIEYQLQGVGQMQVHSKIGLTFSNGLRSILRQDPDIVMIGEIRDKETAEIAIQASLTGHRVFSTLHTNDAATGVTRLIDMGVEPFLITSSVNAIMAQRLVRKICPDCLETYKPTAKELKELGIKSTDLKDGKLFHGKGCESCLKTGYIGRVGIYELLTIDNDIRKLIISHSDSSLIKEQAVKNGMITLYRDGLNKAIQGLTTIEEVLRVSSL